MRGQVMVAQLLADHAGQGQMRAVVALLALLARRDV